jgi:hypothetical protein
MHSAVPGDSGIRPGGSARNIWNKGAGGRSGPGVAAIVILYTAPIISMGVLLGYRFDFRYV